MTQYWITLKADVDADPIVQDVDKLYTFALEIKIETYRQQRISKCCVRTHRCLLPLILSWPS